MKKPRFLSMGILLLLAMLTLLLSSFFVPSQTVTGKSPAVPLNSSMSPEQMVAQELALTDVRVQEHTRGKQSEVMGISTVGMHFPKSSSACATATCWQVEIYNWHEDAAITAIVNTDQSQVLDVLYQPGMRPGLNQRNIDLALDLAMNAPEVREVLGYRPVSVDMAPVPSDYVGTECDTNHYCVGPTINMDDQVLWIIVDLTDQKLIGLNYTDFPEQNAPETWIPDGGCPEGGTVNQDGWVVNYETTNHDGLRVYDVTYNGVTIMRSSKTIEWHADYGSSGFRDETGCTGGGGGFSIFPFGATQENILTEGPNPVGFEIVQDFRMGNWGANCNYRYEQHFQFFDDGRFRVVAGAYGRGCGSNALYRPVIRIDLALGGQDNNQVAYWDSSNWVNVDSERWFLPTDLQYFSNLYPLQVSGNGLTFNVEPAQGQFGDGGRGDDPFIYVTQYNAAEGATDLGVIGSCCNDDHRQGPDQYVNGENVADENIVLWYVSQADTDVTAGNMYCWTVAGEPNPETYPCFTGPMFVPAFDFDEFIFFPFSGS